ncbi:hypothetical protein RAS12_24080 [Achromobacter seleniivolatilans]|uniref:Uncharacterized protein n=1 Tax=Achromobacter seleniivolatilans TaxID=3047478 RepID=A0ABY9M1C2_9BURK|nr:hypothetical protein [Achromobacter sp. R39]WMD19667.1 hypothetical protein RAS12_24080 [Achromobacter sp. R39]
MDLLIPPPKRAARTVSAIAGVVAAIALSGCAGNAPDLRVSPESLDFDYSVSTEGEVGVVRAFGDQGKTIVVLDQPLPAKLLTVPVDLSGGARDSADVQGNYIFVAGRPDRFSVLLPAGRVDIVRTSAPPLTQQAAVGGRSAGPQEDSEDLADDLNEIESNLDWGAIEGQRDGSSAPTFYGGSVPTRPGGQSDVRQGPLPTSVENL